MKRLSLGIFAFLLVLVIAGAGFRKPVAPSAPAAKSVKSSLYYFYTYPDDTFNDLNTVSGEETELENEYGVVVNQWSAGGTLLMRGYVTNAYPHNFPPSVFLYGHF
jgi:hypothetical protein